MRLLQKLAEHLKKNKTINRIYDKIRPHLAVYVTGTLAAMYFYGMIINSFINAELNFTTGETSKTLSLNPFVCIRAVFTPQAIGFAFFAFVMFVLITGKGLDFITGVKLTKDERGFVITNEGTHGISGWMNNSERAKVLDTADADSLESPVLARLKSGGYIGLKNGCGLNKHIMVYGASGAGKSRGFVKPFILKTAQLGQSMVIVDPKAEFFEQFAEYLKNQGYVVKAFNLLDMENSDGWNCIGETEGDVDMVQAVAEVIIRNTSEDGQKADFWDSAEQNLLIALMLYVQSLTDPMTGELLPIHERSLGTIYKMLSEEGAKSLDMKFQRLPADHPARAPYGIFKQAASSLWGNIFIGLGSRLNVFQNKLVDTITKYHDIDLSLPGRRPCAYFCIISDQDSSYEFLSSLFFSLLFKKLSDYARNHGDERGRLPVEVNCVLDEFCNIGRILDFKKTISTVRSRGINCQVVVQSIAQLADRYPVKEWEEIVGNCDAQLFLGCNDTMTSEFISKRCGNVTVQLTNSTSPQPSVLSPVSPSVSGYRQSKSNSARPLMFPEEVLQMDNKECLVLLRGQKPLRAYKIIPDELSAYSELVYTRIGDYIPKWRTEEQKVKYEESVSYDETKQSVKKEEILQEQKEEILPEPEIVIQAEEYVFDSEAPSEDSLPEYRKISADEILKG